MNQKAYGCGYHGCKTMFFVSIGLIIGFSIVYWKFTLWGIVGLIFIVALARLLKDAYDIYVKGEADVDDKER